MGTAETTCVIVGCGPAGAMLGYLLARAGLDVLVLEKHADFLRDFRGDTIHPSTLNLIDELGLGPAFAQLPMERITSLSVTTDDGDHILASFTRLPGGHQELGLLPQWDFLDFLVGQAERFPTFRLIRGASAVGLLTEPGRVVGVRYETADGEEHVVRGALVAAADGRSSVLRAQARLPLRRFGAPMDVLWFALPRKGSDPDTTAGRISRGRLLIRLNRGAYWQTAFAVPKGGFQAQRDRGIEHFRAEIAGLQPFLADRVAELKTFDDIRVLDVQVDRLTRWHRPGLLCLGDAAHAMSPIGGVGINLAIQDAVAAARLLLRPLRENSLTEKDLARVQRRRKLPTVITQTAQRAIQSGVLRPLLAGDTDIRTPRPLRLLDRFPVLRVVPAYLVGIGVRPEHAPGDLDRR